MRHREQVVRLLQLMHSGIPQSTLHCCLLGESKKPSLHLLQVTGLAQRRQLLMVQLGTQFPEEILKPPTHVWQVVLVAQARQLLMLQLGTHSSPARATV